MFLKHLRNESDSTENISFFLPHPHPPPQLSFFGLEPVPEPNFWNGFGLHFHNKCYPYTVHCTVCNLQRRNKLQCVHFTIYPQIASLLSLMLSTMRHLRLKILLDYNNIFFRLILSSNSYYKEALHICCTVCTVCTVNIL